ncbi:TlpA family protein disulfide reductase [Mucilaginibacter lacusdianchii]|uniref:TlpA family protein disulfide reductase n=1 Tax=Mucilaginibacter lacusdianchii TaxID=2684211 RepID=UPI00131C8351|nr:TlpA disulfide reductase family protein [Mucilaginibacter sp. JXJ CY 39]
MGTDTTVAHNKELFLKVPDDKQFGYYYSIETDHQTESFHRIDLYSGKGIQVLSPADTTFFSEETPSAYGQSIIGSLKFVKSFYDKRTFPIKMATDTVINGTTASHIVVNVLDTTEDNEHLYSRREFYINKGTGLPILATIRGRYKYRNMVTDYYDEKRYFDYQFNQTGVNIARFAVPNSFRPRKESAVQPTLLTAGALAPDWSLYDVNGNRVSLSQLNGKVVVMDFYFIGCAGCMLSIKPLNAIYEKYKNKDVVIVSLSERDSKKAVLAFEKQYKIKYSGYIEAANVVKAYHVSAFPTYYFIDKEGKVASTVVGYDDDFEQKVTDHIEKLLNK